jgi:hypothetical protein
MRISSFIKQLGQATHRFVFPATLVTAGIVAAGPPGQPTALGASATAGSPPSTTATREPVIAVRPAPLKAPAEYRLVYKFEANKDVHMPLSVDSKILVQKGPAATASTNQSTVERHFHVALVEGDGSAIVELFIDRVNLGYAFNGGAPTNYDTNTPGPPPRGFEAVKQSVGPHGLVRFSPVGAVLPVAGIKSDPSTDPSDSFLDPLPAKPVRIGEEWIDDIKVKVAVGRNLNQRITLRRRYTLEAVNGNLATIRLRTMEITPVEDPQIRAQLVQRTPEGTITFDLERGAITARELTCSRTETGVMGEGSAIAATTHWKGSLR